VNWNHAGKAKLYGRGRVGRTTYPKKATRLEGGVAGEGHARRRNTDDRTGTSRNGKGKDCDRRGTYNLGRHRAQQSGDGQGKDRPRSICRGGAHPEGNPGFTLQRSTTTGQPVGAPGVTLAGEVNIVFQCWWHGEQQSPGASRTPIWVKALTRRLFRGGRRGSNGTSETLLT